MTPQEETKLFGIFVHDDDGWRTWATEPFRQGEYVIATDTRMLIKVRKDLISGEYSANDKAPLVSSVWPESAIPTEIITKDNIFDALKQAGVLTAPDNIPIKVDCPECNGSGTVKWEYRDRTGHAFQERYECPVCEGECDTRNGSNVEIGVYEHSFAAYFLVAIWHAMKAFGADSLTYSPPAGCAPALFKIKDGVEIIGMHVSECKPKVWIKKRGSRR